MPLTARSSKVRYRSIPLHNLHCGFHPPVPGSIDSLLFHYWHIERSHPPHPPSGFRWKAENIGNRPDSTGSHGKSTKRPVIPGNTNPLSCGILGICAVSTFHRRNQITQQLIVIILRQPERQRITGAVRFTLIIIGRTHHDHGTDFSIRNPVIQNIFKFVRPLRRSQISRFITHPPCIK